MSVIREDLAAFLGAAKAGEELPQREARWGVSQTGNVLHRVGMSDIPWTLHWAFCQCQVTPLDDETVARLRARGMRECKRCVRVAVGDQ